MANIEGYDFPDELYYHPDHAWVRVESDGSITIGMNEFFQREAGDIVYVDLPFEGDAVEAGGVMGKLQSVKWIGKLVAPVSGEVIAVNEELEGDSSLINKSPYDKGWIAKLRPSNLEADKARLMFGQDAIIGWLQSEIARSKAERKE